MEQASVAYLHLVLPRPVSGTGVTRVRMEKPTAPTRPVLSVVGSSALRVAWSIPDEEPEVTASTVKLRIVGSQKWGNYDHASGRLVAKGGSTVPAPLAEVTVLGCELGLGYEAIVALMNSEGWSDVSPHSESMVIGEPRPRETPPAPAPPTLIATGPGKLKCSWVIPEGCPPVEASQLQVTDMSSGMKLLVDAANGKMVASGRTTFAAPRCEAAINGIQDGVEYVVSVCCRNAEGFGQYSMDSEPVVRVDPLTSGSGMELVLHEGPPEGAPLLEPLDAGNMRISWTLPEEAKSTTVKLRRVGDKNWYLCGGKAIASPANDTVAVGLEEGIEYEATVAFLMHGRWGNESPVSVPRCIGDLKLPGAPGAAKAPSLMIVDGSEGRMRVKWRNVPAVPPVTGAIVKFRALGSRIWRYVDPRTMQLVDEEPDAVLAPVNEQDVVGVEQGIRYEASVALRNKLGNGPNSQTSDPVCIGTPLPRLQRCTCCQTDFDMQHTEYTKDPENFWCPLCRFRNMDPFNALVEPQGFLMCSLVTRPDYTFSLDLPDLKAWRKDEMSIYMRTIRVDSDNCAQTWPYRLSLEANGNEAVAIKEPEEGHVRRDVPKDVTLMLRPGLNTIHIKMEDEYVAGFAMALVRTQARTPQQLAAEIAVVNEETALQRLSELLQPAEAVDGEDEEDISCVISNKLKLRCPLSFERVVIPVRGASCMHLQCFGLEAFLESNLKMRALNNRWTCPVCGNVLRPSDLRVDNYVERVLVETPGHIDEVEILEGGSYRCIEEEAPQKPPKAPLENGQVSDEVGGVREEAPKDIVDAASVVLETVNIEAGAKRKELPALRQLPPAKKRQRRRQRVMSVAQDSDEESEPILR